MRKLCLLCLITLVVLPAKASDDQALLSDTTGRSNTAAGSLALQNNIAGSDNTATGRKALHNNTDGWFNTADGLEALGGNTYGCGSTASGFIALGSNTTGNYNTAIGYGANVASGDLSNATAIGANTVVDASNKVRLGNGVVTVIEGQVAYTFASDKTQKENFRPVEGEQVLAKIRGLNLTSWNYIGHDPNGFGYGPVSQEFFGAFGHDGVGTIGNSTAINSGDMEGILMIAVQTLEKRTGGLRQENKLLKETVKAFQAQNAELKSRLEALERKLGGNPMK